MHAILYFILHLPPVRVTEKGVKKVWYLYNYDSDNPFRPEYRPCKKCPTNAEIKNGTKKD